MCVFYTAEQVHLNEFELFGLNSHLVRNTLILQNKFNQIKFNIGWPKEDKVRPCKL